MQCGGAEGAMAGASSGCSTRAAPALAERSADSGRIDMDGASSRLALGLFQDLQRRVVSVEDGLAVLRADVSAVLAELRAEMTAEMAERMQKAEAELGDQVERAFRELRDGVSFEQQELISLLQHPPPPDASANGPLDVDASGAREADPARGGSDAADDREQLRVALSELSAIGVCVRDVKVQGDELADRVSKQEALLTETLRPMASLGRVLELHTGLLDELGKACSEPRSLSPGRRSVGAPRSNGEALVPVRRPQPPSGHRRCKTVAGPAGAVQAIWEGAQTAAGRLAREGIPPSASPEDAKTLRR